MAPQAVLPGKGSDGSFLLNMAAPLLSVLLSITVGVCGSLVLGAVMRPQATWSPSPATSFKWVGGWDRGPGGHFLGEG